MFCTAAVLLRRMQLHTGDTDNAELEQCTQLQHTYLTPVSCCWWSHFVIHSEVKHRPVSLSVLLRVCKLQHHLCNPWWIYAAPPGMSHACVFQQGDPPLITAMRKRKLQNVSSPLCVLLCVCLMRTVGKNRHQFSSGWFCQHVFLCLLLASAEPVFLTTSKHFIFLQLAPGTKDKKKRKKKSAKQA